MKILQAVTTSHVETLENRQGIGLVLCSRMLPDSIRIVARDWGYASDAKGDAIFSFRWVKVSEVQWPVMNRTVPATDFTGRTSYVSHTIAIHPEELGKWLMDSKGTVMSPFEFMRKFPWRDTWTDSPKWIEESDDKRVEAVRVAEDDPVAEAETAFLLAFDATGERRLTPRCLAWKVNDRRAEEVLRMFHRAWLLVDPWRGGKRYEDHLEEPECSMGDAWKCTFATNLRHERTDPYNWIVLSEENSAMGTWEVFDAAEMGNVSEEAIIRKIGEPLGPLLVERSKNPKYWAQKQLEEKIAALESEYGKQLESIAVTEKDQVTELIEKLRSQIKTTENFVIEYTRSGLGTSEKEDVEKVLSVYRMSFETLEGSAKTNHTELMNAFQEKVAPLKSLLHASNDIDGISSGSNEEILIFNELHMELEQASEKYKEVYQRYYYLWMEKQNIFNAVEHTRKVLELTNEQAANVQKIENLKSEISIKHNSINSLQETIADLKTRMPVPKRRKQIGWEMYSLIFVSVLALGLTVIIALSYKKIFLSEPISNLVPTYQDDSSSGELKRNIASQRDTIEHLKASEAKIKSELGAAIKDNNDLKDARNKLDAELKSRSQEILLLKAHIPAESKAAESKPAESKPAESKAAESKAAESKPAESKPAESKPAESKPAESKPAESKAAESKPADPTL